MAQAVKLAQPAQVHHSFGLLPYNSTAYVSTAEPMIRFVSLGRVERLTLNPCWAALQRRSLRQIKLMIIPQIFELKPIYSGKQSRVFN